MKQPVFKSLSVILMTGAAVFALTACAPTADSAGSRDGAYYDEPQNQDLLFQDAGPDEVRYGITRDMYDQGFYLAYDGNPLVFERRLSDYGDTERVSYWFYTDGYGTRVRVNQVYFTYGNNGWYERRDWDGPGQPLYMYGFMGTFRQEFYQHPRNYWEREREHDRDRDWSRRDERDRWERERPQDNRQYDNRQRDGDQRDGGQRDGRRLENRQEGNRLPPLPAPTLQPQPQGLSGGQHQRPHQEQPQGQEQRQGQPQRQNPGGQNPGGQYPGGMNFQRQDLQNRQDRRSEPKGQAVQPQGQSVQPQPDQRRQLEQFRQQQLMQQQQQQQEKAQQQIQQQQQLRQQQMFREMQERQQKMQEQQRQMRDQGQAPQVQPQVPQSQRQQPQWQQPQPAPSHPESAPPSSGPTQKQIDDARERFKNRQPQ
jgi:hypothetical protein